MNILGNELADQEAKDASKKRSLVCKLPSSDFKPVIRSFFVNRWQLVWDTRSENKLHNVKPLVKHWSSPFSKSRRNEIILARLRIGHTRLTHGYLMENNGVLPYCLSCIVPLTVEHIMLECPDYSNFRRSCFVGTSFDILPLTLGKILAESDNFSLTNVIRFLTSTGLIKSI